MSSIVYISSDEDSDVTIPFDFSAERLKNKTAIKNENAAKKTATKSTQTFHVKHLIEMDHKYAKNYERLKCATKKLRKLLHEQPANLHSPRILDELTHIWKLDKRWDWELSVHQAQCQTRSPKAEYALTPDELLASIKRKRWCHTCLNAAFISEERLLAKYFCSIECQLEYYDT